MMNNSVENALHAVLEMDEFDHALKAPTCETQRLLNQKESVSAIISFLSTDNQRMKRIVDLFKACTNALLENLVKDSQALLDLSHMLIGQNINQKIAACQILSAAISQFSFEVFSFFEEKEFLLKDISKQVDNNLIYNFVYENFLSDNGVKLILFLIHNVSDADYVRELRQSFLPSLKLIHLFLQGFFVSDEVEEKLCEKMENIFKNAQSEWEKRTVIEVALRVQPINSITQACLTMLNEIKPNSSFIDSILRYFLHSEEFPSSKEIEKFIFRFLELPFIPKAVIHPLSQVIEKGRFNQDMLRMIIEYCFHTNQSLKSSAFRGIKILLISALRCDSLDPISTEFIEASQKTKYAQINDLDFTNIQEFTKLRMLSD